MLAVVLFAVLGGRAAFVTWRSMAAPVNAPRAAPPAVTAAPALQADLSAITNRHLFGAAPAVQDVPPPPTRAALVLGGIWYSPTGEVYALIGEPGAPQKTYRQGERLPGGVELAGVEVDRVLLRREGKIETLALPRVPLHTRPAGATTAPLMAPVQNP